MISDFLSGLIRLTTQLADIGKETVEAATNCRNVIKGNGNPLFMQATKAPLITAGTSAGIGPTITLDAEANNHSGLLSVTTGTTTAAANNTIVTLTFATPFPAAPHVTIHASNAAAIALAVGAKPFATASKTAITISAGSTALTASTAYAFTYHCTG